MFCTAILVTIAFSVKVGMDDLSGGLGNDYLSGGNGGDTYHYNQGDGSDTIEDNNVGGGLELIR